MNPALSILLRILQQTQPHTHILLGMESSHVAAVVIGLVVVILFVLWEIGVKVTELSRTLRRIEARMTLANPLEEEQPVLELGKGDVMTRATVRNRAIQPDVWWHRCYEERKNLRGKKYKEERKMQRYIERTDRN